MSPISAIPHKSKAFRSILDLTFLLKIAPHGRIPIVNEKREKTAPGGAIDQIGHVLLLLIHAFAEAPECAKVFQGKWDIKDGFWRIDCKEGEECNFCYVLPQKSVMPITLLVITSLQMGWIELPTYFCTVSETGKDVAEQYIDTPMVSLAPHKFVRLTEVNPEFAELPKSNISDDPCNYMMEIYMDDYVALDILTSRDQPHNVANALMKGIHDVLPP